MSHVIRLTCPNCQRDDLRIRSENLGRRLRCNHCEHVFRTQAANEPAAPATADRRSGGSAAKIGCPGCQRSLSFRGVIVGKKIRCKYCGRKYYVHSEGVLVPFQREQHVAASPPAPTSARRSARDEDARLRAELDVRTAEQAEAVERLEDARDQLVQLQCQLYEQTAECDRLRSALEAAQAGAPARMPQRGAAEPSGDSTEIQTRRVDEDLESTIFGVPVVEPWTRPKAPERNDGATRGDGEVIRQLTAERDALKIERDGLKEQLGLRTTEVGWLTAELELRREERDTFAAELQALRIERAARPSAR